MSDNKKPANPFIQSYKKTEVNTATPEKLLLLMYEGLLRFMNQSRQAGIDLNQKQKIHFVDRSRKIVAELRRTLNHDVDPEVTANLDKLYNYLNLRLLNSLVDKDSSAIDECLQITNSLYESWKEAVENVKKESQSASR